MLVQLKKLATFNKLIFILNCLVVALLLLAYLASVVSPQQYWFLAFLALFFPILYFTLFVFFIYWLIRLKWHSLFSLIFLVLFFNQLQKHISINLFTNHKIVQNKSSTHYKILSYNVRVFDSYNWPYITNPIRPQIINLLRKENPSILNLQEFYINDKGIFNTHDTITKIISAQNSHVYITKTLGVQHWGIVTYTIFPIVNKGLVPFPEKGNNVCIYTDILIKTDTIRIYNCHLQSVHFSQQDYDFLEGETKGKDENIKSSERIFVRLKNGYIKRAQQVEAIANHIKKCNYKSIITGDFNDTPSSYTYNTLTEKIDLKDAFMNSNIGWGKTYIFKLFPLRIDYILSDKELTLKNFKVIDEVYSDHYPIKADIYIK